jgi:hypothetical protein
LDGLLVDRGASKAFIGFHRSQVPMGWEEILFKTEAALAYPSVIVDSWARSSWSESAAAGHSTVMSNSGLFCECCC